MRISPASCLLAPGSQLPGQCLQGFIQNPCPAQRRRKASCGGKCFPKSQYWLKFPYIQNLCPASVGGKPCAAGKVFRYHNTGPNSPPCKTLARPGVGGKLRAAERFSEITILAGHEVKNVPADGLVTRWLGGECLLRVSPGAQPPPGPSP